VNRRITRRWTAPYSSVHVVTDDKIRRQRGRLDMGTNDQGKSNVFGEGLPGTGGDFIDTNDTEGHKANTKYEPPRADGGPDDFLRTKPIPNLDGSEEDVEGHRGRGGRIPTADGSEEGAGPDDFLRTKPIPNIDGSDEDVEGHLYTGGPSTQGEFSKRAPSDSPHGER